jgi:hypothetical protein
VVTPVARRSETSWACEWFDVSVRWACEVLQIAESTYRYKARRQELEGLRERMVGARAP